jgi:hypothetical protein
MGGVGMKTCHNCLAMLGGECVSSMRVLCVFLVGGTRVP